jgi:hypothetical protein
MAGQIPLLHETTNPARRGRSDAQGFSLMEAIVATVIAVLAAIGLAYSFGVGRGNINRLEVARVADGRAQARMEFLGVLAQTRPGLGDSLTQVGVHPNPVLPFIANGDTIGSEYWRVDPAPASVPLSVRGNLTLVTVEVAYVLGGVADTARYGRIFGR